MDLSHYGICRADGDPSQCRDGLVVDGLLDIGVLIYYIANGMSYAPSLNIFAVIAGIRLTAIIA